MASNASDGSKPNADANGAIPAMSPEELAILKHRLATIDNAITGEELFARVKEEVKKRAAGR